MDVFDRLTEEHERHDRSVTALLDQSRDDEAFETLRKELAVHMKAEERVVLKPLSRIDDLRPDVLESIEEHRLISFAVGRVKKAGDDDRWRATVEVLAETLRHHEAEEEKDIFPEARESLGATESQVMLEEYDAVREAKA